MNRIQRLRGVPVALTGLAVTWLGLAAAAPAAFARIIPPPGGMIRPGVGRTGHRSAAGHRDPDHRRGRHARLADRADRRRRRAARRRPGRPGRPRPDRPPQAGPVRRLNPTEECWLMPRFMDFHPDLKLPGEAIAQIADDTRHERADQFGVRQLELYHNAEGQVYCLLDGPDEEAIRHHHAALGVPCGDVHQVDTLT
jgi:hypothetical protein